MLILVAFWHSFFTWTNLTTHLYCNPSYHYEQ